MPGVRHFSSLPALSTRNTAGTECCAANMYNCGQGGFHKPQDTSDLHITAHLQYDLQKFLTCGGRPGGRTEVFEGIWRTRPSKVARARTRTRTEERIEPPWSISSIAGTVWV